jgi:hypothetical protein
MANVAVTRFEKGHIPWNKGRVGVQISTRKGKGGRKHTNEEKIKIGLSLKKEKHWNWKGGKPRCSDCGKILSGYSNKKCVKHKGLCGENNYRWISDRTKVKLDTERGGPLHKQWSVSVKNRDGWKCRIANKDCEGEVVAHHILGWSSFPELRYEINNGITLCHTHHPRKRKEEKLLVPVFNRILEVSLN